MRFRGLRVVKVGGSLWELPQLAETLRRWIQTQPAARNVLVTGGGAWAEEIRHLDRSRGFSPVAAHGLAIRAMSLTGWLLCHMLEHAVWGDPRLWPQCESSCEAVEHDVLIVCDSEQFLRDVEPHAAGRTLPVGWHVTSDSIAARLAEVLAADELVLLKSVDPPSASWQQAVQDGLVDAYFPEAVQPLAQVRWINLRRFSITPGHARSSNGRGTLFR